MTPLEKMLSRLEGVQQGRETHSARCPAHDDKHASLSIRELIDGRVLLYCHAGCDVGSIVQAVGLTISDLFPDSTSKGASSGLFTLEELSRQRRLPLGFLISLGLTELGPFIRIPYLQANGTEARPQLRMQNREHRWGKPDDLPIVPYGLERLDSKVVALVEGASDCWTLWKAGFPALGLPGANMHGKLEAEHIHGLSRIDLVREADDGGKTFERNIRARLNALGFHGDVLTVHMAGLGAKDPSALYMQDQDGFADRWGQALEDAQMLSAHVEGGIGQKEKGNPLGLFKSTAELAADPVPPTSWYIPSLIPKGAFIQLSGSAKGSGKTTFTLYGCSAILHGKPFLGKPTVYTPIVFLTEQGRGNFEQEYLETIGLMDRDDFWVLYGFLAGGYSYKDIIAAAVEKCRQVGAGILIVDTFLYWSRVQDEDDSAEMQKALRSLRDAASSGLSVLVNHHDRKGGGNTIEAGRGSSAFAGIVDVIHNLRRPQERGNGTVRELRSEGRYGGLHDSLMIELTKDGYVAHGSRADVSQEKAEKTVMRVLPTSEDDALTMAKLLEALEPDGVGRSACQRVIDKMEPLGRVRKIGTGKKGDGYRYYLPLDEQICGNGQADLESTAGSEMLSAQYDITTGQKEIGVNGHGFIWEKDEETQG